MDRLDPLLVFDIPDPTTTDMSGRYVLAIRPGAGLPDRDVSNERGRPGHSRRTLRKS